jgi:hypothetical protein
MSLIKSITTTSILAHFLATIATCEPFLVGSAQGISDSISKRDEIVQGWALVEDGPCPDGTGRCGKATCCPFGSYCDDSETLSNFCCPTREYHTCPSYFFSAATQLQSAATPPSLRKSWLTIIKTTGSQCGFDVQQSPRCAVSTWVEYRGGIHM